MAQLKKKITFNQHCDAVEAGRPLSGEKPRRSVLIRASDPARVPDGYDPNLWHIALYFHEEGRKQKVPMAHRPPLIYERVKEAVEDTGLRKGKWTEGDLIRSRRTGFPGDLDFVTVMEKMVRRYWNRYHDWDRDPRADEHFTQLDVFTDVRDDVLHSVVSRERKRQLEEKRSQPGYRHPLDVEMEEAARQREAARATAPGTNSETDANTIRIGWHHDGHWRVVPRGRPGFGECISWVSPEWVAAHSA